ncbi:MAG: hypothetical protein ACRDYZ_03635 [Acidimicrobiales bacterium]
MHGARFSSALHALSTSSIARKSGATVQTVAVHPGGTADVGYIIDVDGTPALPHQHGTARRRGGRWKVGDATFCHLVGIEGKHPSACSGVAAGAATGGSS